MRLEITQDDFLTCPQCGNTYLHHGRVEYFARDEDAATGKHSIIEDNGWCESRTDDLKNNPSARRGGILIHFDCELCSGKPVLSIAQHKGITIIQMGLVNESIAY